MNDHLDIKAQPIETDDRDFGGPEPSTPRGSGGRATAGAVSFLVAVLILAVTFGALWFTNHRHDQEADAGADATKAVAAHLTELLSYTPATVTSDLETEKKWITGDFLDEYTALVEDTIGPAAVKGKVTADATVVASGVQSASTDRVELVLFVNVATVRTGSTKPENQGSRVRVVAEKVDGEWLISSLSPV